MKKLVKVSAVLGIILGTQSAIATPFQAEVSQTEASEQTPNQMIELLQDWGFETVECQGDVVNMKHDVTGEIGCAVPDGEIQAGNFIYNSAENTISPMTAEQSNQLEAEATPQNPPIDNAGAAETEEQSATPQNPPIDNAGAAETEEQSATPQTSPIDNAGAAETEEQSATPQTSPIDNAGAAETEEQNATPQTPLIDNSVAAETEEQSAKAQEFVFGFDNAYDYSACLDVILLAYEGRQSALERVSKNQCARNVLSTFGTNLSKDAAFQLVKSANAHATEVLRNPLYPVFGIRRRVAINFGYVYDLDENNSDILELINS
ncbi:exported hypothetical protein [Hyella patelloides LEGE 07179]|uniref:DUF4476 domain-containing protein n=1 Tax=Hyella patelloides LEGE 07179 TaxID=945734 RepID=A0A563W4F8_9CYAN|nr:hypothetical protein [Hyella patelloides]VEP18413.1 exported hypothetical protein [Hyella patelloides LEGE 07179]